MAQLPHYLRSHRKRLSLSQGEVAFLLGNRGGADISRYERFAREPSLETILALELIAHYQLEVLVLQDTEDSRRSPRIKALSRKIIAMARNHKVGVKLFSQEQVRRIFFADGKGTKHAVAEIIAKRFPEELASRLPPKRKPWMSEHYQMDIFDAVALALVFRLKQARRR